MSWLDKFFAGVVTVSSLGVSLPAERTLNFLSGFTAVDNPNQGRTDVSFTAGSIAVAGDVTGTIGATVVSTIGVAGGATVTCALGNSGGGTPTTTVNFNAVSTVTALNVQMNALTQLSFGGGGATQTMTWGAPSNTTTINLNVVSGLTTLNAFASPNYTNLFVGGPGGGGSGSTTTRLYGTGTSGIVAGANSDYVIATAGAGITFATGNGARTFGYFISAGANVAFNFDASTASITWEQSTAVATTNPASMHFAPQAPNASSTTAATNTPGSFFVDLASPGVNTVAGNEPYLTVTRGGTTFVQIGRFTAGAQGAMYFGNVTPGTSNYTIYGDGSSFTYVNGVGAVAMAVNNTLNLYLGTATLAIFAAGGIGSFGGGTQVVFLGNTTTAPTSNPTGGGIIYCQAGALKYRGTGGTVTTLGAS